VRHTRALSQIPTDIKSARAIISNIPITVAVSISTEGMPSTADANAKRSIGDASKLGIGVTEGVSSAEQFDDSVAGAAARNAATQTWTSNGAQDAKGLYANGSWRWGWPSAKYCLQMQVPWRGEA
jgi:hypothetical protein